MIVADAPDGVRVPAEIREDREDVAARPARESLLGGGGPDGVADDVEDDESCSYTTVLMGLTRHSILQRATS